MLTQELLSVAGSLHPTGYIFINLFRKRYSAHRLAWFYVYGIWPKNDIDHINRSCADNRILNLRDVTKSKNQHNSKMRINNTSGIKGVSFQKRSQKWRAVIDKDGEQIWLGEFIDKQSAIEARRLSEIGM